MPIIPDRFDDYAHTLRQIFCVFFGLIGVFLLGCFTFTFTCTCLRFISIKLGKKIKPDGKKGILITGATSGIGLLLAKHFYKLGFSVFAAYYNDQEAGYAELLDLSLQPLDVCSRNLSKSEQQRRDKCDGQTMAMVPPRLFLVRMDVRSQESIENSSREIDGLLEKHNIQLSRLINNAGISRDGPFEWCSRESMRDVIETNLVGVLMVTRQFIFKIIEAKGRVINVSSGVYLLPSWAISIYGASKSAVAYFSDSLNEDIKDYGASCHCVVPGNFITNSNIIYTRVRACQESISKLSEVERTFYRNSIDRYCGFVNNFLRLKLESTDDNHNQIESLYKIDIPEFSATGEGKLNGRQKSPGCLYRIFASIIRRMDGGAEGKCLEETGIVDGYELAVLLESPPRRLFAGNSSFSHVWGPGMELMPSFMHGVLGPLLTRVLSKE